MNEHRNPAQVFHRVVEEKNSRAEGGKFGEADPVVVNIDHRQNDPEGGHGFDQRLNDVRTPAHTHAVPALRVTGLRELRGLIILSGETLDHTHPGEGFLKDDGHLRRLALLGFTGLADFSSKNHHGNYANREEHERRETELPINCHQDGDACQNRNGVFNDVAGDRSEGILGDTGVAHHTRHEFPSLFAAEEIQRLRHQVGKKFGANVAEHPETHPRERVDIQVRKNSPCHHHKRDQKADPNHAFDSRTVVGNSTAKKGRFVRKFQRPAHQRLTGFLDN